MNNLESKRYITEMLAKGFVLAPCATPHCEQLFSSGLFCSDCEEVTL
jgi:hypothetical protein